MHFYLYDTFTSYINDKITSFALPFHSLYHTCSIQKLLERIFFSWSPLALCTLYPKYSLDKSL